MEKDGVVKETDHKLVKFYGPQAKQQAPVPKQDCRSERSRAETEGNQSRLSVHGSNSDKDEANS